MINLFLCKDLASYLAFALHNQLGYKRTHVKRNAKSSRGRGAGPLQREGLTPARTQRPGKGGADENWTLGRRPLGVAESR